MLMDMCSMRGTNCSQKTILNRRQRTCFTFLKPYSKCEDSRENGFIFLPDISLALFANMCECMHMWSSCVKLSPEVHILIHKYLEANWPNARETGSIIFFVFHQSLFNIINVSLRVTHRFRTPVSKCPLWSTGLLAARVEDHRFHRSVAKSQLVMSAPSPKTH